MELADEEQKLELLVAALLRRRRYEEGNLMTVDEERPEPLIISHDPSSPTWVYGRVIMQMQDDNDARRVAFFNKQNQPVAWFKLSDDGTMDFTGNPTEAARLFLDAIEALHRKRQADDKR